MLAYRRRASGRPSTGSTTAPPGAQAHRRDLGSDRDHPALGWWLIGLLVPIAAFVVAVRNIGPAVMVPEWLSVGLTVLACTHFAAVAAVPVVRTRWSLPAHAGCVSVALVVGACGALWVGASGPVTIGWLVVVAALGGWGALVRSSFSPGLLAFTTYVALVAVSGAWGAWFLASLHLSMVTTILLWAAAVLTAACLPSSVVQTYEAWETVIRHRWSRPRLPASHHDHFSPTVMIHVPIHAEPPDLVIATLDRLAALDYARFSVLVIDNNTVDDGLWRPVEEHCRDLGERFDFVHLMGVEGAKAGALNAALDRTPSTVDLVGVVDADYQVRSDWLRRTAGHFVDESIAFVQCPHAYRDCHTTRFGRMAQAEYRVFFDTSMVAYNERDAALTVGTMSLIRRDVLESVGGWAPWCLTEDSELSVRIHAAGHSSVYLTEPMGRGLIPETFAAYRTQRFRWTYGPVQELRAHQRLFLPSRARRLTPGQMVHHGNHGLDVALIGVRFLTVPVAALAALSMVVGHEIVPVPLALWIAATCLVASSILMRFWVLRAVLGYGIVRILGSILAYLSLTYVIQTASLRAVFARPAAWTRTTKFRAGHHRRDALLSARHEIIAGLAAISCAVLGLVALPHEGVAMMLLLGTGLVGAVYLTAPIVALIADRDIETRAVRSHADHTIVLGDPGSRSVSAMTSSSTP
jgi:Glycosyltransferase like family 2